MDGWSSKPTSRKTFGLDALNNAKFGFIVASDGKHTALFSKGNVYEVHWDKRGDDLFEKSSFSAWGWVDGIVVIPPDSRVDIPHHEIEPWWKFW